MSYEKEVKMLKKAFDNNIIRIPIPHFLKYTDAKKLAEDVAGGLPSTNELIESGV